MKYADAGVDIHRGSEAVQRIKRILQRYGIQAEENIGRFGGIIRLPKLEGARAPLLVASIDGAGTKTLVAGLVNRWDVVGYDVINHGVNDVLVQGALPFFALDYIGTGRLNPDRVEALVEGMAKSCRENGVILIGGETAEMPDIYQPSDADVVAVVVGLVDEPDLLGDHRVRAGDVLVGLASTGLHTNGYSLARKIFFETLQWPPDHWLDTCNMTLADALLQPHRSYLSIIKPFLRDGNLHALSHITGGGLTENLPRILPRDCSAVIRRDSWPIPPLFALIQQYGDVPDDEMFRTFNMGVGMVAVVDPSLVDALCKSARDSDVEAWVIGEVVGGEGDVCYDPPFDSTP